MKEMTIADFIWGRMSESPEKEEMLQEAARRIRNLEAELQAWKAAADNGCGCDTPEGLAAFINCCNC